MFSTFLNRKYDKKIPAGWKINHHGKFMKCMVKVLETACE
jgi:hypothetical protein